MTLSTREAIAVAELVVYIPAFALALLVCFRQGFVRQLGFLYLVIFTAIRIAGAAVEILSQKNPTNASDAEWAGILSTIGISPLLLASTGLLKRVNDLVETNSIRVRILQFSHIPCLLGLILGIYGGTKLSSDESTATTFLKAAAILFLLTLVLLVGVAGATWPFFQRMPQGETKVYLAVVAAVPFLAVRVLYSILADFENNDTFGILNGNAYVQLGMEIIEEMVVAVIFIAAGLLAPRMRDQLNKHVEPGQMASKPLAGPPYA